MVQDGDKVRVDLNKRRVDLLVSEEELKKRREDLEARGGYHGPPSQTYWQDVHRREVTGLDEGMVMKRSLQFQNIVENYPLPRDNH